MRMVRCVAVCVAAIAGAMAQPIAWGITTDAVVNYNPGDETGGASAYQNGGGPAVGLPASVNASFDPTNVTPFTPAYDSSFLTLLRPGGEITLHFAQPVTDGAGPEIGVFSSIGIVASGSSSGNNVSATDGPATFSDVPNEAIVSVSTTGAAGSYVALNGGAPILLNVPTNAFLNTTLSYDDTFQYVTADGGTTPANFSKPFTGGLSAFSGLSYAQMLTLLNGSAGGTWLDLSGTGLSSVNYIRFDVPGGAGYQLLLDGVTAVPEPASLGVLTLGFLALARRGRR